MKGTDAFVAALFGVVVFRRWLFIWFNVVPFCDATLVSVVLAMAVVVVVVVGGVIVEVVVVLVLVVIASLVRVPVPSGSLIHRSIDRFE